MALDTSVNEAKWVLTTKGQRSEITSSASTFEVVTVTWAVTSTEHKYYAITRSAAESYMTANPTLDLSLEMLQNIPNGCNIIKRAEVRTIASITSSARPS